MLSSEDFVTSAVPAPVSNEELVALNPMYQHLIDNDPDAYYPWTSNLDEIAAEEEEIPIPCGYTNALYAMTATTDEQLNDYYALLDTHITAEFAAAVPIMDFMRTEGIKVFTNMHMNWDGIQGIEPFELDWLKTTPAVLRPSCRPVKKAIWDVAEKEFNRLRGYLLFPSDSPVCSNIVVASKATPPYVRICGDYVRINEFIQKGHYPIPFIRSQLDRIQDYSIYADIDFKNAFHQVRIGPISSARLSITTPWGQFQSPFMQEGTPPATGKFMEIVNNIFEDYKDWILLIHDNMLILAHTCEELFEKVKLIVRRCLKHNMFLKMEKSMLGIRKVKFFGYECEKGSFRIDAQRRQDIQAIPRPLNRKGMQSLLGTVVICSGFIPDYSSRAIPLYNMTTSTYDWTNAWSDKEVAALEDIKQAVIDSCSLHYPDESKVLVIETDASDYGWGSVLYQIGLDKVIEPIAFMGRKFTDAALKWYTYKKECYSEYASMKAFEDYIYGRWFYIYNDHQNLLQIAASTVPIIVRMRLYMQSHVFFRKYIKGTDNWAADFMSRMHESHKLRVVNTEQVSLALLTGDSIEEALDICHKGPEGHGGLRRTYLTLCRNYPGHQIPQRVVAEYVAECPECQKIRHSMNDKFQPLLRANSVEHHRQMIGIDGLTITPEDIHGMAYAYVIKVFATKLVAIYPTRSHTARDVAQSLYAFRCTYGHYETVASDPGCDLTAEGVQQYLQWAGQAHRTSLVDRHQSNGVEVINRQIMVLLRALVCDRLIQNNWSEIQNIGTVQFIINQHICSETQTSAFNLTFGDLDSIYMQLPEDMDLSSSGDEYVKLLQGNLQSLRSTAAACIASKEYQRAGTLTKELQNIYQEGDFLLYDVRGPEKTFLPSKLSTPYKGPYVVMAQYKNDITCKHTNTGMVQVFHIDRVKPFYGTPEQATTLAQVDYQQFLIETISAYRGDPNRRTKTEFLITYADGTTSWKSWDLDLYKSLPYEQYCRSVPQLYPLVFTVEVAAAQIADINKTEIETVRPGLIGYMDLRWYSFDWYATLGLPNEDTTLYVLQYKYGDWLRNDHLRIRLQFDVTGDRHIFNHYNVLAWGSYTEFAPTMVLCDQAFIDRYPQIMGNNQPEA